MKTTIKRQSAKLLNLEAVANSPFILKKIRDISELLPDGFKTYDSSKVVTFNYTTEEKIVDPALFAKLFGESRELMGFLHIPRFKDEVGVKYLLKTRYANYIYVNDFHFGDTIKTEMFISEVEDISFNIMAFFTKKKSTLCNW